ncbi:mannosyltransferase putative-domain-containing protein [Calycina marina]|uniref:Mannosyltransferase putative-domain-containing protein n=1 Tax=Calycina marina TaxID=1763456 RepID=A0A9P7Z9R2_9HELO|nr:mannosyltransferase putative-domain-containing protein [Calycina marina]
MYILQARRFAIFLTGAIVTIIFYWAHFHSESNIFQHHRQYHTLSISSVPKLSTSDAVLDGVAKYFIDYKLDGPEYGEVFGELGRRVQILTDWIGANYEVTERNITFPKSVEAATQSMFPFIQKPGSSKDASHLSNLRNSFVPGSRGIVMALGTIDFRYACHFIVSLRNVLNSSLPVQIMYAGEEDLPSWNRQVLAFLANDIEFVDILTVFDDVSMQLERNWAIKPFAALASKFEQVIMIDADAVFLQPPDELFNQHAYKETGTLFFHDRLLWQYGFPERHEWWGREMRNNKPSQTLMKSKVWTEKFAEEMDSGVVVLDKRRLPIFTSLFHVCWQNTKAVRDNTTYKMTYGDKESWWFGMELCGVPYSFEKHYGAMIGHLRGPGSKDVCSFTIAHADQKERLLWFNGSLLKNKHMDKKTFEVPTHWMADGKWQKGARKVDLSCMVGGNVNVLTGGENAILAKTIEAAKDVDKLHSLI